MPNAAAMAITVPPTTESVLLIVCVSTCIYHLFDGGRPNNTNVDPTSIRHADVGNAIGGEPPQLSNKSISGINRLSINAKRATRKIVSPLSTTTALINISLAKNIYPLTAWERMSAGS